jgi:HEAT repeat protein
MNRSASLDWVSQLLILVVALSSARSQTADLRKQLKDPAPAVRKQAALKLAEANDAEAIPVLIDLLAELPAEERRSVEDFLTKLAGEWAPLGELASEDRIARKIRRDAWMVWWRNTDGDALLAVVRAHTLTPELRRQINEHIVKLGDDDFSIREAATKDLFDIGRMTLPQLRQASKDHDLELSRRARDLIERIEREPSRSLPAAVVRLLALRKPSGAIEALLAYLPLAEEDNRSDDIKNALALLALRDGKLDAALVRALADDVPQLRALAAEALAQGGGKAGCQAVRKLLQDDVAIVRLRAALALTQSGDKDAVPVLIDLLAELPDEQSGPAEAALYQLAGDAPPKMPHDANGGVKNKRRDVWAAWWKDNNSRIDLSRLRAHTFLNHTVICDNFGGRVFEIDRDGKELWSIGGLQIPLDAVVLPGNRVLIAEYRANRVAERDFKGRILWQKTIVGPVNAQRLPNGNTFIATEHGPIVEVDRSGKALYSIPAVPGNLLAAYRRSGGDIVCKTADGMCRFLDTSGKQLKSFAAGHDAQSTAGLDVAANGHFLITRQAAGKVVEFDRNGKSVLEWSAAPVGCASLTPSGHVLIPDYQNQRVYEKDRAGKIVWEYKGNGHFIRARRR